MQGEGVYSRAYYQENKNIILQRNKKWDEEHKDRRKAYNHNYYLAHKQEKQETATQIHPTGSIPDWLKRTDEEKKLAKKLANRKYRAKQRVKGKSSIYD